MRPRSFVAVLLASCLAWSSAARAGGNNLSWDACGSDGTLLKAFACDRNTGADVLVASTRLPLDVPHVIGVSGEIDLVTPFATWPDWWRFFANGTCRRTSLGALFTDPGSGAGACTDPWAGIAVGAVMGFSIDPVPFGLARVQVSSSVANENAVALAEGDHVFVFALRIDHQRTVGADACTGCQTPVCILLRRLTLHQPVGEGDHSYFGPDERDEVFWQSSSLPNGCFVPTRNRTWGAIKGMYR